MFVPVPRGPKNSHRLKKQRGGKSPFPLAATHLAQTPIGVGQG